MIHYHGSPLGGPVIDRHRFYRGRHALVSHAYVQDLPTIAEMCQSFVLDNGAFTAWKQGKKLDFDAYCLWVEEWNSHPGFDWALIPDVIDGSEEDNDFLLSDWPTNLRGVPVYHLHESMDRLDRLVQTYPIVALGSSGEFHHPGSKTWWQQMEKVMKVACDAEGRPRCRLHGLRMMSPKVFTRLPLTSADSTNATMNAGSKGRFGMYLPVTASQRAAVIADRVESYNSARRWGEIAAGADFDMEPELEEATQL